MNSSWQETPNGEVGTGRVAEDLPYRSGIGGARRLNGESGRSVEEFHS